MNLLSWLCCFSLLSANEQFTFRPQTTEEAFSYVEDLYCKLPWFKENGYTVVLPEGDKHEFTQIYNASLFDPSLQSLKDSEPMIKQGLEKLSVLQENWGFKLMEKYEVVLTLYGPGGDYNSQSGSIRLFTTPKGAFKRSTGYEVLLHEIVHIGIEEIIVKKYQLSHWEKERLVDLICSQYLSEVLPAYKMQQKGDQRIDAFVAGGAIIYDLPSAIANFVEQHPR